MILQVWFSAEAALYIVEITRPKAHLGYDVTPLVIRFATDHLLCDNKQTYTKTKAYKLYSRVFWIFLSNVMKIDP